MEGEAYGIRKVAFRPIAYGHVLWHIHCSRICCQRATESARRLPFGPWTQQRGPAQECTRKGTGPLSVDRKRPSVAAVAARTGTNQKKKRALVRCGNPPPL